MKTSIRKRLLTTVILTVVCTIVLSTSVTMIGDMLLQKQTDELLIEQARGSAEVFVNGQTAGVNEQLVNLIEKLDNTARFTEFIYQNPDKFAPIHTRQPKEFPADTTGVTFHWAAFTEEDSVNEAVIKEADMLSALEGEFYSLTKSCPMIQSLYVATGTHINIGYDEYVLAKLGGYNPIEAGAQWYLQPMENGKDYVSEAYSDAFERGLTVTISSPFFVDGEVRGVIGADINIQNIEKNILDIDMTGLAGYPLLFAADGTPISAKNMDENTTAADLLGTNYEAGVKQLSENKTGWIETRIGGSDMYVIFDTIETTGWKLAVALSVDEILAPTQVISEMFVKIGLIAVGVILVLLLIVILVIRKMMRNLTQPILDLTSDVARIGDGNLDYKSTITTGDEIQQLGESFEQMTTSLKEYITNLTTMTAENERIGAELNVANHIQASMLPCIFPAFPDRDEFDIYATMNPAKEVGGDFYDFFMVDDTHVAIVMADVSGKGVPAALFMVIGKTLIKDHTTPDCDLGKVFTEVNDLLCQSNDQGLFITAFEGVLDLVTGEFRYVNAGHEMPFICKKNEGYKPYKIRSAFVLAGMDHMRYKADSFQLEPGDKIFQYTDGVTEATNANNELYGMERLEKILTEHAAGDPYELLPAVKSDIDHFVGEAPQFDDITMLCLEYKRKGDAPRD